MKHKKLTRRVAALVLGLALLFAACSSSDSSDDTASAAVDAADAVEEVADSGREVGFAEPAFEDDFDDAAGEEAPADDLADDAFQAPQGSTVPPEPIAATGERIIKEGTITIEVEQGSFDRAFADVVSRAQALGGHVVASTSSTDDEGLVVGSVTVRVPVQAFESLLTSVGDVGEIVDRNVSSQDVSAEFTDLEGRRRHLQAQERFYLELLNEAVDVSDAIAVQQQLEGIQAQIEQITGRLNFLSDRTAFSTLTARINELDPEGVAASAADEEELTGLAAAWDTAVNGLLSVLGALLIGVVVLTPIGLLALLGWVIYRQVMKRRPPKPARPHQPAAPQPVYAVPAYPPYVPPQATPPMQAQPAAEAGAAEPAGTGNVTDSEEPADVG